MLIEWILAPIAIGTLGVVTPKFKMSDKRKIEKIFQNMKVGVVEKDSKEMTYPKFFKKEESEVGVKYTFTFPLGLSSKVIQNLQDNGNVFSDGLNKPVEVEFDGMLHINAVSYTHLTLPTK